jgi:hypothetical protein
MRCFRLYGVKKEITERIVKVVSGMDVNQLLQRIKDREAKRREESRCIGVNCDTEKIRICNIFFSVWDFRSDLHLHFEMQTMRTQYRR